MYSTRLINNRYVDGNRYITVGDPYKDFQANMFRQPKKGEKAPMPFRTKVKIILNKNFILFEISYIFYLCTYLYSSFLIFSIYFLLYFRFSHQMLKMVILLK
jgi:hypothetical protein